MKPSYLLSRSAAVEEEMGHYLTHSFTCTIVSTSAKISFKTWFHLVPCFCEASQLSAVSRIAIS
jgi:hypothetical protein